MFHDGDLNSGISTAIQQQKLVLCFVREDDNEESETWENAWLHEEDEDGLSFGEKLNQKAVLLRIEYGSKEAGFLGAFCTVDKAPCMMVIHNGQVLEQVEGGTDFEHWRNKISKACNLSVEEAGQVRPPAAAVASAGEETGTVDHAAAASSSSQQSSPLPSQTDQQSLDSLFPDRSQRHDASLSQHRAIENAALKARQEARKREAEEAYKADNKGKAPATSEEAEKHKARDAWIYQQKKRKDEAKRDRERILNQIEADKQERKARSQRARTATVEAEAGASSSLPEARLAGQRRSQGAGGLCALQVRLFDGSSIRNRFSTSATLDKDVRDWVKEASPPGQGGADIPFTFRQILAPQPSRSIELSEEHHSLTELGLVPNGTLVLVPVSGYTEAYASGSGSGVLGMLSGAWNSLPSVSYFLPSFSRLYLGGTSDPSDSSNVAGASMAGADPEPRGEAQGAAARVRVKTLADQRAEAERKDKKSEFYNGNSLGFEGRKDDEHDEANK
ncbi:hypothetical protein B0A50_06491 [Salinomyces thailandicus]|uniref:UBX domain-containing protein n=1 Tax=Salinomyces thailandicus TaxID=706561 RepID=A0A4U0TPJ0_9PEZI|nr:hypothetical protein B0A50_06491 [Salinomyces thailandica]